MCILQPSGVFITFTNFCPTAAELLFHEDTQISIIKDDPTFSKNKVWAGHDARKHIPPLLRPNVPMSWETFNLWEKYTVEFLSRKDYSPEEALILLAATLDTARKWDRKTIPLFDFLSKIFEVDSNADPTQMKSLVNQLPCGLSKAKVLYIILLSLINENDKTYLPIIKDFKNIYASKGEPADTESFIADYNKYVKPFWKDFEFPIRRYLISKIFATYYFYQGNGLWSGLYSVITALAALRIHSTLLCTIKQKNLNKVILKKAFGYTDYILLHGFKRRRLIEYLDRIENCRLYDLIASIPD